MIIYFNNEPIEVEEDINVEQALMLRDGIEHMAVWLNGNHLALSEFRNTKLTENDRLNVVRIRGGG